MALKAATVGIVLAALTILAAMTGGELLPIFHPQLLLVY
jgi:hypothetical protein